ncbi:MAG: hypothetical protein ABSC02_02950 [Acidobacteriota bacterium]|jgi:uncharacterized membrane protein
MRSKTSAALMLIAIFLLGGISGAVSGYLYQNHIGQNPTQRPPVPTKRDVVEEIAQSLHMDAHQKENLKDIIKKSGDRYSALSVQFRPQYEQIRTETDQAIRAILRPDQRQHFEETLEKMDARRRALTHDAPPARGK